MKMFRKDDTIKVEREGMKTMDEYKNIEYVNKMEDGSMNVVLRNGRRALIEIQELNSKFQAAVYALFTPDLKAEAEKKDTFAKLGKHDAYKECAKEALGWVDQSQLEDAKLEEVKEF